MMTLVIPTTLDYPIHPKNPTRGNLRLRYTLHLINIEETGTMKVILYQPEADIAYEQTKMSRKSVLIISYKYSKS